MADDDEQTGVRRTVKSETAFRTISEVADDLDVPQHVLRFWESKFPQVKPLKRGGGRRYYRPEDIALLRRIRDLLYSEGYTIKGVQKLLREGAARELPLRHEPELGLATSSQPAAVKATASFPVLAPVPVSLSMDPALPDGETDEDEYVPEIQDAEDDLRPRILVSESVEEDDGLGAEMEEQEYVVNQAAAAAAVAVREASSSSITASAATIEGALGSLGPLAALLSQDHVGMSVEVKTELRDILAELEQIRNLLQPR